MRTSCLLVFLSFFFLGEEIKSDNVSTILKLGQGKRMPLEFGGLSADKKDLSISFPIQFRSFQSFFRTSIRLSRSAFSIYFQLKTKLPNGLIMLAIDENQSFLFCVELHHGKIRYIFKVDGETKVMQRPLEVSDGVIHEVHIQRPSGQQNILRVDDSAGPSLTSGKNFAEVDDSECEIHMGGTSGYMYGVLPDAVRSTDGYVGCMFSVDLDGNPWSVVMNNTLIDDKFKDQIVQGCDEKAGAKPITENFLKSEKSCDCQNGGVCTDTRCDCKFTSYSGATCGEESESFNFSSGGIIVYRYQLLERPDSPGDVVVFGIKTLRSNSTLVTITDDHFKNLIEISLSSGKAKAFVSINRKPSEIRVASPKISDGEYHVVRFFRIGSSLTLQVDGHPPRRVNRSEHYQEEIFFKQSKIIIGGTQRGHEFVNEFNGLLAGLYVNKMFIFEMTNRKHVNIVTFGSFGGDINLHRHMTKHSHKEKVHFHSRNERLPTNPAIKRLRADDDIIVPASNRNECEDFDAIPEFCEHNLSDDSFVFPSFTSTRVTWRPIITTSKPTESCNTSVCPGLPSFSSPKEVHLELNSPRQISLKADVLSLDRIVTLEYRDRIQQRNTISMPSKISKNEDEVIQENYSYVIPDHLVSSMITNVLLTIGISMSSIVLVIVMLYVAKKCSGTKKNEVYVPEEINKFITHSPPQISTHSFLNVTAKNQGGDSYVKEWFI